MPDVIGATYGEKHELKLCVQYGLALGSPVVEVAVVEVAVVEV